MSYSDNSTKGYLKNTVLFIISCTGVATACVLFYVSRFVKSDLAIELIVIGVIYIIGCVLIFASLDMKKVRFRNIKESLN